MKNWSRRKRHTLVLAAVCASIGLGVAAATYCTSEESRLVVATWNSESSPVEKTLPWLGSPQRSEWTAIERYPDSIGLPVLVYAGFAVVDDSTAKRLESCTIGAAVGSSIRRFESHLKNLGVVPSTCTWSRLDPQSLNAVGDRPLLESTLLFDRSSRVVFFKFLLLS